jgi:ligand-binding sensor domain-containing protein
VKRAFAIAILILVSSAQSGAEQLPIRTYTTADGLARDRVYKIVSDPRGYLWFCTYDGLSRFDGYEFVNYSVAHGLPHRQVFDLLITRSGDYWVATSAGLAHFNPIATTPGSKFKAYVPKGRPDAEVITDLYEDSAGTIWISTSNGLHVLRQTGNDWQIEYVSLGEKPDDALDLTSIIEGSAGVLWIGTEQGLFRRFSDGRVERFGVKDGLPHPHVRDILKDPDGTLWVATGLGLCRLVSNVQQGRSIVERLYTKKDGMLGEGITALFRTSSGWLWLATTVGLAEFSPDPLPDGGHFINYTREHGMSDAGITSIAEDRDGNLWAGSESGGAMKITQRGFTSYTEADGLELSRIVALGEDRSGEFFVVTGSIKEPSFHIHRFNGRSFENIRVNLPANVVPSWGWNQLFLQDRMQQWWVPANGGLFQFPPVRSLADLARAQPHNVLTSQNGLSGDEPFRLYEDSRGDIWISIISTPANSYLNRWERATGEIHTYSQQIALRADSAPTAFQEDRSRNIWVGFYWGGIARYRNGRFDSFSKTDGVPAGMIRAFYLDHLGRLWIASTEGGLARIDYPSQERPTFVHYTVKEGLSSDQITCITEDQWGRIYMGHGSRQTLHDGGWLAEWFCERRLSRS